MRAERVPPQEVPPLAACREQQAGAVLIDVREARERAAGTPAGAVPLALPELVAQAAGVLPDRAARVLVLCGRGVRSRQAAQQLGALGYGNVASVAGGFQRWQAEGLPCDYGVLDADAAERYARQLKLPQVGAAGQARLAGAKVFLLGAGGLGAPVALYLAAAGVGHLTLVDDDRVERSNLHRQVIHGDARVGQAKTDSARASVQALNPRVRVEAHAERLTAANVEALVGGHDLIVDGADNFAARYLLSAASVRLRIPLVYGAVEQFTGQASVFDPRRDDSPCYRCLFPAPPAAGDAPNCSEAGVFGVLPGLVGMIQATEALKLLLGIGAPLVGRLLSIDALAMRFREFRLPRDPHCPGCGVGAVFRGYQDIEQSCRS
ncbi:MAG TPA: molybdopterin-synthase adenylyltransferase MoeB [Rhodanobacteraceae bacterium]|nr:molybdopterin-synthase adenylyltransferase MoeB [Rhodanobacteraceae bacterium]